MANKRGLELARRLWGWAPHSDGQRDWMLCDAREKVAACGRRWGKSESTAIEVVLFALSNPGSTQMIIAPRDDQTKIIMGQVVERLRTIPALGSVLKERRSPHWEISIWEGNSRPTVIRSRTAGPDGEGLRGRSADRVIVDEAAYVSDRIMNAAVSPLLADTNGQMVLLGTPDGQNHFSLAFRRGQDPLQTRTRSFRFPTTDNPIISLEFIEEQRRIRPEQIFRQEYEAAFLDREGAVFRKVMVCAATREQLEALDAAEAKAVGRAGPDTNRQIVIGVDWARSKDFTVFVAFDIATRRMVNMDRMSQVDFALQRSRLKRMAQLYAPIAIVAEANSIGQPNIEALQADGMPVVPFTTTNASKAELVDTLALALERQDINIFDDPVLTGELMAYSGKRLPSGLMQYGAPDGQHDDCVMALMLAVWGAGRSGVEIGPDIWV